MSLIKTKEQPVKFPIEIFGEDIKKSFEDIAMQYSVPIDFFGTTGLFTVASLSGNMFRTELNGKIKTFIYAMLLGPSSLGKTVVYDKLFGDIIQKQDADLRADYLRKIKAWNDDKERAKIGKYEFTDPMPQRCIRVATNGTLEAFMKYAETNPAGFGIYFDEGKQLYSGGAYKKENHSVDFWNKVWNGKTFNDLRVDSERERFVQNPAISVLAGMQTDRINEMFNKDIIDSGLFNRFLFCSSGYIQLNENIDHFSDKKDISEDWRRIVMKLFHKGTEYYSEEQQIFIPFKPSAKILYNKISSGFTSDSNRLISDVKDGDESKMLIGYMGKLYAYFGRFVILCAIIRDIDNIVIDDECIYNAEKVYNYFKYQAKILIKTLSDQVQTSLNEKETKLLLMLPDKFTLSDAKEISKQLKLSDNYFSMTFLRKYKQGFIRQNSDKSYEKI